MKTILIVDDRSNSREYLKSLLDSSGHTLLEAADGPEALERVRTEHPDLIITDIVMPSMDGFEFVRKLRTDPASAQTRVVFYTAMHLDPDVRELAQGCGVTQILAKPADHQEVLGVVNTMLEETGPTGAPMQKNFNRDHLRLLTTQLSQKVDELEDLNAELERRVRARTVELAAANAHLRELHQLKDELLLIVSHDLRSPLIAIELAGDMLRDPDLPDESRRDYVNRIGISARRMMALIDDLLDLAKIEIGMSQLNPSELYVSRIIRQSIDALAFNAKVKDIELKLSVGPAEPLVSADAIKLSQVFNNLLSNAVKFTPRGGQITFTVRPAPEGVQVSVTDNGVGIPPQHLPHIFEKCRKTRRVGTEGERGTGLGLAIVHQLVALHGGSISVQSDLNHGTTFAVYLPRSGPAAGADRSDAAQPELFDVFNLAPGRASRDSSSPRAAA